MNAPQPDTSLRGFVFVVAVVCAAIIGLFALPYLAMYFTRGC